MQCTQKLVCVLLCFVSPTLLYVVHFNHNISSLTLFLIYFLSNENDKFPFYYQFSFPQFTHAMLCSEDSHEVILPRHNK